MPGSEIDRIGRIRTLIGRGAVVISVSATLTLGLAQVGRAAVLNAGWTSNCSYTRSAMVDPIVAPGGTSEHLHDFYGNAPDPNSTYDSLRASNTKCTLKQETAAYWTPSLYTPGPGGGPVQREPRAIAIYWTSPVSGLSAMPPNLKMIAGDHMAPPASQDLDIVWFDCAGPGTYSPRAQAPYLCEDGNVIRGHVRFPSCWDGTTPAAVGDDSSHMVYPKHQICPTGYITVPQMQLVAEYPVQDGRNATLSSGMGPTDPDSIYTYHSDFFNAWDPAMFQQLVDVCLNGPAVACGSPSTPIIKRVNPGSGSVGTAVTIGGSSLTSTLSVKFNGTPAAWTSIGNNLSTVVPAGATTGKISITTDGGTGVTGIFVTGYSASAFGVPT